MNSCRYRFEYLRAGLYSKRIEKKTFIGIIFLSLYTGGLIKVINDFPYLKTQLMNVAIIPMLFEH